MATDKSGFWVQAHYHMYVSLYWQDKFIFCLDNCLMKAEEMIYWIERRTRTKFRDLPLDNPEDSLNGLLFFNGGWKRDFWKEYPDDDEIKCYIRLKYGTDHPCSPK